jgi:hypothetical protein
MNVKVSLAALAERMLPRETFCRRDKMSGEPRRSEKQRKTHLETVILADVVVIGDVLQARLVSRAK